MKNDLDAAALRRMTNASRKKLGIAGKLALATTRPQKEEALGRVIDDVLHSVIVPLLEKLALLASDSPAHDSVEIFRKNVQHAGVGAISLRQHIENHIGEDDTEAIYGAIDELEFAWADPLPLKAVTELCSLDGGNVLDSERIGRDPLFDALMGRFMVLGFHVRAWYAHTDFGPANNQSPLKMTVRW